jgi:hypothetical protein
LLVTRLLGLADWPGAFPQIAHAEFWNLQQALASSPEPFAMSCQLNLQCDAAILLGRISIAGVKRVSGRRHLAALSYHTVLAALRLGQLDNPFLLHSFHE